MNAGDEEAEGVLSTEEAFRVIDQIRSMGKPVVVGARGTSGFREQVIPRGDGICGYHINPYDPLDIAHYIVDILKHPDLAATMGRMMQRKRCFMRLFLWVPQTIT